MNGNDPKWQNYFLWLADRGLTTPRWTTSIANPLEKLPVDQALKAIFISDLELKERETELLEKMAEALHMSRSEWSYVSAVKQPELLQSGVPDASTLDRLAQELWDQTPSALVYIAFGPLATRIACGKGSFSEMRGQFLRTGEQNILATYHPRDLLKRVDLKRDAWTDLQLIIPRLHD